MVQTVLVLKAKNDKHSMTMTALLHAGNLSCGFISYYERFLKYKWYHESWRPEPVSWLQVHTSSTGYFSLVLVDTISQTQKHIFMVPRSCCRLLDGTDLYINKWYLVHTTGPWIVIQDCLALWYTNIPQCTAVLYNNSGACVHTMYVVIYYVIWTR